jgi:serine protease inhibitor
MAPMSSTLPKSANEFAVDLFQCYLKRHGDKYSNLLLCPYLIYHSLAMMLVGAKGNTADQLMKLLRIDQQRPEIRHKDFLMLTEQLIHGNHDFIHLASFIYLDKSTKRTENFKSILKDYYETKPKKIDFGNVDMTVKTINEDVARTTENIYSDILSKAEAQKLEKSMLLVSAVFFRGFWLSNFTEVTKAPFFMADSKDLRQGNQPTKTAAEQKQRLDNNIGSSNAASQQQTGTNQVVVQIMSKLDYLTVVSDTELDARMIKMPFEASDLQMLLILPNDRKSNAAYLCDKMTASKIDQILDAFIKTKARSVRVTMPIFCIDSGKISIQSTLVTMGASDLFDKSKANMSGICENKQIWLNKILHRCFIICDNRGSITSSSYEKARKRHSDSLTKDNSVSFKRLKGVEEFCADHAFMYMILDSVTGTILMIGLYTDPKQTLEVVHENQLSPEEAHELYTEGIYKT